MDEIIARLEAFTATVEGLAVRLESLESSGDAVHERLEGYNERRRQEIHRVERDLDATRSELRSEIDRVRRDVDSVARRHW